MSAASFCVLAPLDAVFQQKDMSGWTAEIFKSQGGAYLAQLGGDDETVYLRLYDARSKRIFAARTYPVGMSLNLQWRADRLIYETAGSNDYEERYIDLPPTYLDWLFARWP